MAWELSFTKRLTVSGPELYINDCCWGGDQIRDYLLPLVEGCYEKIQTCQEDWGWFIWFRRPPVRLAIDIYCDDPEQGEFRVRLSAQRKRWLFDRAEIDTPELERLKDEVVARLNQWVGKVEIERV
jgi:hypothetical protein